MTAGIVRPVDYDTCAVCGRDGVSVQSIIRGHWYLIVCPDGCEYTLNPDTGEWR